MDRGRWGGGLTSGQSDVLKYLSYNPVNDTIENEKAFTSNVNEYYLWGMHKMSSWWDNVFFSNLDTDIDYSPVWQWIKDQSNPSNRDETGLVAPSWIYYDDDISTMDEIESNPIVYVNAEQTLTISSNTSAFWLSIRLQNGASIWDEFRYQTYIDNSSWILVYSQKLKITSTVSAWGIIEWWFDHPLDTRGNTFYAIIEEHVGDDVYQPVSIAADNTNTTARIAYYIRNFETRELMTNNNISNVMLWDTLGAKVIGETTTFNLLPLTASSWDIYRARNPNGTNVAWYYAAQTNNPTRTIWASGWLLQPNAATPIYNASNSTALYQQYKPSDILDITEPENLIHFWLPTVSGGVYNLIEWHTYIIESDINIGSNRIFITTTNWIDGGETKLIGQNNPLITSSNTTNLLNWSTAIRGQIYIEWMSLTNTSTGGETVLYNSSAWWVHLRMTNCNLNWQSNSLYLSWYIDFQATGCNFESSNNNSVYLDWDSDSIISFNLCSFTVDWNFYTMNCVGVYQKLSITNSSLLLPTASSTYHFYISNPENVYEGTFQANTMIGGSDFPINSLGTTSWSSFNFLNNGRTQWETTSWDEKTQKFRRNWNPTAVKVPLNPITRTDTVQVSQYNATSWYSQSSAAVTLTAPVDWYYRLAAAASFRAANNTSLDWAHLSIDQGASNLATWATSIHSTTSGFQYGHVSCEHYRELNRGDVITYDHSYSATSSDILIRNWTRSMILLDTGQISL